MSEYTPFAGLLRLEPGDAISLNNYEFYDNEQIEDAYFHSFINHRHNGAAPVQPFASAATLTPSAAGGVLSGGETWYIGITAVDEFGGETTVQTASTMTLGGIVDPTDALTVAASGSGSLKHQSYRYAYAYTDLNGETKVSPATTFSAEENSSTVITVPSAPAPWRLYRSAGYGQLARVATIAAGTTSYRDIGSDTSPDQIPNDENTTGRTGRITITRPDLPASAAGWKVYASQLSTLASPSLLASGVASGTTSVGFTDPNDIGFGKPPNQSRTIGGASLIFSDDVSYNATTVKATLDTILGTSKVTMLNGLSSGLALYGSGGITITATGSAIVIGAGGATSLTQALGDARYLQLVGGTMPASAFGETIRMIASGTAHKFITMFKASGDTMPRVWFDHDGTYGQVHVGKGGSDDAFNSALMTFNSNNRISFPGSFGVDIANGINLSGGNLTVVGASNKLEFTGGAPFIDHSAQTSYANTTYKSKKSGDSSYAFFLKTNGQMDFTDGVATPLTVSIKPVVATASAIILGDNGYGLHRYATTASAGNYTLVVDQDNTIFVDNSANVVTVTLPASPRKGDRFTVKLKSDGSAFNVTIGRNSKKIEGATADYVMNTNLQKATFHYDGTEWWIVA